jgi:hypothetical protein
VLPTSPQSLTLEDDAILGLFMAFWGCKVARNRPSRPSSALIVMVVGGQCLRRRCAMAKPAGYPAAARRAAARTRAARADENARKLAPLINAIQAEGTTSLNGIAAALNVRRVPTPHDRGYWHPMQVARILKRLAE